MSDEALAALREEFADTEASAIELRARAREVALELAGRGSETPTDADEE